MAEIVNLRRARKARAKAEAEQEAARNRSVHGLSRNERAKAGADRREAERYLDGHRLERDSEE